MKMTTTCTCGLSVHARGSRRDPTHTLSIRNAFTKEMKRRFLKLRLSIKRAIVDRDVFGLNKQMLTMQDPNYEAFDFVRSQDKVAGFSEWLQQEIDEEILGVTDRRQIGSAVEQAWTNKYIEQSYLVGIDRARAELIAAGYDVPSIAEGGMSAVFNQSMHADRVGLLYTRAYSDLKGITDVMDTQLSRMLSEGIAKGMNPNELARLMNRTITGPSGDLGITDSLGRYIPPERRAKMLARTEVIRAHHEATIQEYENWGAEGVKVKAEWVTAGYNVCPICSGLEGQVFTLAEIRPLIPRHPNCRCAAIPVDMTGKEERKVSKELLPVEPNTDELEAIKGYTAMGGPDAGKHPFNKEERKLLEQWLDKQPKRGDAFSSWRGMSFSEKEWDAVYEQWITAGSEHTLPGIQSFSLDKSRVMSYGGGGDIAVKLELRGISGVDISDYSIYKVEKEVLYNKNIQFIIRSVEYDKQGGIWRIFAEEILD